MEASEWNAMLLKSSCGGCFKAQTEMLRKSCSVICFLILWAIKLKRFAIFCLSFSNARKVCLKQPRQFTARNKMQNADNFFKGHGKAICIIQATLNKPNCCMNFYSRHRAFKREKRERETRLELSESKTLRRKTEKILTVNSRSRVSGLFQFCCSCELEVVRVKKKKLKNNFRKFSFDATINLMFLHIKPLINEIK